MKYPDAGFRLLSLYRYWNIIQYYFPYRNLIEEDWKNVLKEFVPKYINAFNELEYKLAVLELIGRVHDTHANIYTDQAINKYHGVYFALPEVKFIEDKAVVTGFRNQELGVKSGLIIGDVITSINNKPVDKTVRERLKYYPASNYPTQLRGIALYLLRSNDTTLNIEFIRNRKSESRVIKTYSGSNVKLDSAKKDTCFKMITSDIGYIYPGTIKSIYLPKIMSEVQNTKGIIIDLRCYPSEFVVFSLGRFLMPDSTAFVKFTGGSISIPGLFTLDKNVTKVGNKNPDYYKGKVIILVNEETQSQAEYTSMAFRVAPKATVIGSTTAGADGNVASINLPGGIQTRISGIGVYYPDGRETQRVGIVPDIVVKPTIKGIQSGKDEVLEKAIEFINRKR
jgi:membrane-associated protease RseP (regulator of RpoE activity)